MIQLRTVQFCAWCLGLAMTIAGKMGVGSYFLMGDVQMGSSSFLLENGDPHGFHNHGPQREPGSRCDVVIFSLDHRSFC